MKAATPLLLVLFLLAGSSLIAAQKKESGQPQTLPPIAADAEHPPDVDLSLMSEDPDYGYTREQPIKVGSKRALGGPQAQRDYLGSLLDAKGKPLTFRRLGSIGIGPYGNVLDVYEVKTSQEETVQLYIDMYHPDSHPLEQPAPVGFYKKKVKPLD